jgi:hypothetical protein
VSAGRLLRIDQVAVDDDLEDATTGRDQGDVVDRVLELFEDLGRQTDGLVEVASNGAVFDGDLHPRLRDGRGVLASRPPMLAR